MIDREQIIPSRTDVLSMAREAGVFETRYNPVAYSATPEALERFAALVAAAEREKVAAWMIQRSYATGHGDTTEDLLKELDWQVLANWSSAMKTGAENEREACAKVCDDLHDAFYDEDNSGECAAAIRARGETTSRGQA